MYTVLPKRGRKGDGKEWGRCKGEEGEGRREREKSREREALRDNKGGRRRTEKMKGGGTEGKGERKRDERKR